MKKNFTLGVIISTYNNPAWLEKTLWGYLNQTTPADEIIIADDGSRDNTRLLIESFKGKLPIKHIWHEDNGFQKSQILNKAIVASTADYLLFTDQDCIPRENFLETHIRFAEKGRFLSGGYFRLSMEVSKQITQDDVLSGKIFDVKWLKAQGMPRSIKNLKLTRSKCIASLMNCITPAKSTWNGCNSSGWREDILRANGFNEEMQYGGQDREFGVRMINMGIKPKMIRYSAALIHLDHKRPYKTKESWNKNAAIRKNSRKNKITATPFGITKMQ